MRTLTVGLLVVCVLAAGPRALRAQAYGETAKDPAVAVGLAWLCPGCGHFYTGESTRGAIITSVAVGSLATGAVLQLRSMSDVADDLDCKSLGFRTDCGDASMDLTPILVGGAIGIAAWAYGLIDAGASARRVNARGGGSFQGLTIHPSVGGDGSVGARLAVPVGW